MISEDSRTTLPDIMAELGISDTAVEKHIRELKKGGFIRRIGPARGGKWGLLKRGREAMEPVAEVRSPPMAVSGSPLHYPESELRQPSGFNFRPFLAGLVIAILALSLLFLAVPEETLSSLSSPSVFSQLSPTGAAIYEYFFEPTGAEDPEAEDPGQEDPEGEEPTEGEPGFGILGGSCPTYTVENGGLCEIYNWTGLNATRDCMTCDYILMNDLSFSDGDYLDIVDPWVDGWMPIGDNSNPFTGSFDGNNHWVGLFGYITGPISNLNVQVDDVSGDYMVGGLVGYNFGGIITSSSVHVSGSISGTNRVGGLVGQAYSTITNSSATVSGTNSRFGRVTWRSARNY